MKLHHIQLLYIWFFPLKTVLAALQQWFFFKVWSGWRQSERVSLHWFGPFMDILYPFWGSQSSCASLSVCQTFILHTLNTMQQNSRRRGVLRAIAFASKPSKSFFRRIVNWRFVTISVIGCQRTAVYTSKCRTPYKRACNSPTRPLEQFNSSF